MNFDKNVTVLQLFHQKESYNQIYVQQVWCVIFYIANHFSELGFRIGVKQLKLFIIHSNPWSSLK